MLELQAPQLEQGKLPQCLFNVECFCGGCGRQLDDSNKNNNYEIF